jgi:hypothetical protein
MHGQGLMAWHCRGQVVEAEVDSALFLKELLIAQAIPCTPGTPDVNNSSEWLPMHRHKA